MCVLFFEVSLKLFVRLEKTDPMSQCSRQFVKTIKEQLQYSSDTSIAFALTLNSKGRMSGITAKSNICNLAESNGCHVGSIINLIILPLFNLKKKR